MPVLTWTAILLFMLLALAEMAVECHHVQPFFFYWLRWGLVNFVLGSASSYNYSLDFYIQVVRTIGLSHCAWLSLHLYWNQTLVVILLLVFFFFPCWVWSSNSGLCACEAGTPAWAIPPVRSFYLMPPSSWDYRYVPPCPAFLLNCGLANFFAYLVLISAFWVTCWDYMCEPLFLAYQSVLNPMLS
jgi:hypothetical protein